jgi:hypothetical protein
VRGKGRAASLFFRSDEPGSVFRCRLDQRKAVLCGSPTRYEALGVGPHIFRVAAVDRAGNVDPTPATARFSISPPRRAHR